MDNAKNSFVQKIYIFTIFLSSFLLFQIQPIIGKYILPYFGGSSSVWTISMLFFMTILLVGYVYAHLITKLSIKKHILLHSLILLFSFVAIISLYFAWKSPITPDITTSSDIIINPIFNILKILFISIGLPYFILSTSSSLLQFWFNKITQESPYGLYAYSNAGGLLALLTYPFFIEPFLSLTTQGIIWSVGFIIYLFSMIFCIKFLNKTTENKKISIPSTKNKIAIKSYLKWLALSTLTSVMLLAITNEITQGVAPIPFLWITPLAIYLISFIIAFSKKTSHFQMVYPVLFLIYTINFLLTTDKPITSIISHLIGLFICCMICNGELYRSKPKADYLTSFYLTISIGGALGGILIGILAPLLFSDFEELTITIFITAIVSIFLIINSKIIKDIFILKNIHKNKKEYFTISIFAVVLFVLMLQNQLNDFKNSLYTTRNFYGVIKVSQWDNIRRLAHGDIWHGMQDLSMPAKPLLYYSEDGGIGLAIKNHPKRLYSENMRVGIVGLGTGCLASYGQLGDYYRFYEIDNDIIEVSKDYFSFIDDSLADVDIELGDARILMDNELKNNNPQNFDILAIDAFSDDSIPTHLITKEAMEIYLQHLNTEDGILAYHISNKYLDIRPIIQKFAEYFDMDIKFIETPESVWALLSKNKKILNNKNIIKNQNTEKIPEYPLWTDNYNNVLSIVRWGYR